MTLMKQLYKNKKLFKKLKWTLFYIFVDKILDEIDLISQEQYQFVNATVIENLDDNKLNLEFKIIKQKILY